jgi:hypothetical protein
MTVITGTITLENGDTINNPGEVKQVPAVPTASPAADEYASAPRISLSCAAEGAVIYYHVFAGDSFVSADDIIENGTEYTGPFTLSPFPGTVKATAVKDGVSSRLLTAKYTKSGGTQEPEKGVYVAGNEYDGTNITFCYWKNGTKVPLTVNGYAMIQDIIISGSDVYVLGNDSGSGACYWKNGVKTLLPGAAQVPEGMAIAGSDVYVIGVYDIGDDWGACYWKNGARTALSSNSSRASAIVISASGDVYIAGVDERTSTITEDSYAVPLSKACYWKNGIRTLLTDGTNYADTTAIALSGATPYIVGSTSTWDGITHTSSYTACYWRNTVKSDLITAYNPVMDDIIVSGSDVYVLGKVLEHSDGEWYTAYWKNGNKVNLTNMSDYGGMHGKLMAVSGSNVYVAGDSGGSACYWKNGARNVLSPENSHAAAIAVNGTDFYIAGFESVGGNNMACYWKNGAKVSLPSSGMQSSASGIVVAAE